MKLAITAGVIALICLLVIALPRYPGGSCPHMPPEWAMSEGCYTKLRNGEF